VADLPSDAQGDGAAVFCVRPARWERDGKHLRALREEVFVREQGVPIELELDDADVDAFHVIAETEETGMAIGTGRLLADNHIGRMCVLESWRGRGVGSALLEALIAQGRSQGMREVRLNAQLHALDFYARFGFIAMGLTFMDAGIEHRAMRLLL
jgi:predicted GNAT family N-acyltransferase